MAARFPLPNGSVLEIASAFGAAIPFTAISNAKPPVVTAAAHGLQNNAVLLLESGWARIADRATVAGGVTDDSLQLLGLDTLNDEVFTPGAGIGSVIPASSFLQISKVTSFSASGGEQQFLTVGYLEDDDDRQMPTNRSPLALSVTVEDQPAAAYVAAVEAFSDNKELTVLRLRLPSGDQILYPGYVSITSSPTMERNQLMTRTISVGLSGRPVRILAA